MSIWLVTIEQVAKILSRIRSIQAAHQSGKAEAIRERRLLPWKKLCLHMISILSSILILILSIRNIVFAKLGDQNLNSKLNAMQFVAGLHASILTISLGWIVAAWIHYEMCVKDGVPYGFVTAAYQLSSPELLFSRAFWYRNNNNHKNFWTSHTCLRISICATLVMTALVGPSSAVLLVPQAGWIEFRDPFSHHGISPSSPGTQTTFFAGSYDQLYPSYLDNSSVPPGCDPSLLGISETCPNSFMTGISTWCSNYLTSSMVPNLTVSGFTPILRSLVAANVGDPPVGWSAATVPMFNLSRLLRRMWLYLQLSGSRVTTISSSPKLELVLTESHTIKQPFVQVQCSQPVNIEDEFLTTLSFHRDRIVGIKNAQELVNITISTEDWKIRQDAQFSFVELVDTSGEVELGAIAAMSFYNFDPSNKNSLVRALFPCTIGSRWMATTLAYQPESSDLIYSNITSPGTVNSDIFKTSQPFKVDLSYANALNSKLSNFNLNNQSYNVFEYHLRYFYEQPDGSADMSRGVSQWQWMISTVISLQMAEALSRTQPYLDAIAWFEKPKIAWDFTYQYDYQKWAEEQGVAPFVSAEVARTEPDLWTEIQWKTSQFVYSWSLRQTPSYLAFGIILVHIVLIVCHSSGFLYGKWQCNCCESMLDLLALAMQSPPTAALRGTSMGVARGATFAEHVQMRESEDGKQIILSMGQDGTNTGTNNLLVSGKKYL